jgi:hypothetical protein
MHEASIFPSVIELIRTEFSFTSMMGFDIILRHWEMFSRKSAENVYRISSEWRIWMLNPIKKIHWGTMVGETEEPTCLIKQASLARDRKERRM